MGDVKPFRTTRPLASLRAGRNDWFRIMNATPAAPAQLHIYDEIGYFGVTAADMLAALDGVKGDLEVHLNTPGGEVFDGIAIYSALKQRAGQVRVVVDSLAASIGSVIAMAASPGQLEVCKNASLMIHDGFALAIGNAADMRQMADLLDKTSGNIASIYAERTGLPAAHWRELMLAESWFVGQEAVDAGLADAVQGSSVPAAPVAATAWDLSVFARQPGPLLDAAGDGDGDDDSAWDGPAAMKAAGASDDPAKAFASICAGRRDGPADEAGSYALPHHKHEGGPPNAKGVSSALGRLDQTQGLTNKAAAQAHLEAHQKAAGGPDNHADPMPAWLAQHDQHPADPPAWLGLPAKEAAGR